MSTKRVVAVFTVDTGEDGRRWDKSDVALALDCNNDFRLDGESPDATVWDSVEDFMADYDAGYRV